MKTILKRHKHILYKVTQGKGMSNFPYNDWEFDIKSWYVCQVCHKRVKDSK